MAAYVKQSDQVALIMTKAEASALNDLAQWALARRKEKPQNNMTASAEERAVRALETSCMTGSRMGAAFQ